MGELAGADGEASDRISSADTNMMVKMGAVRV
jgi:hypothetical protein